MHLLSRLDDERKSGAIWYVIFRQSPKYRKHKRLISKIQWYGMAVRTFVEAAIATKSREISLLPPKIPPSLPTLFGLSRPSGQPTPCRVHQDRNYLS